MQPLRIGAMQVTAATDGRRSIDAAAQFPGLPLDLLAGHGGFEGGRWLAPLTTYIIHAAGRTVIVDTGLGPRLGQFEGEPGALPASLRRAGLALERVDVVAVTHLHPDHIGWNFAEHDGERRLTFPIARYAVTRAEWEHWQSSAVGFIARSVLLYDGGEGAVITGDAAYNPAQLEQPAWSSSADVDPALAARSRATLADRIADEGLIVLGGHFPPPQAGRLLRVEHRCGYRSLAG